MFTHSNNTMIVNCLYSMRGTRSVECNSAAKNIILQFCIERAICISAAHIPGKNNTQAVRESRVFIDNKWWNC